MMQKSKNSIRLKSQTGLLLQKSWMMMWTFTGLGKVAERIQKLWSMNI
jgi:hypothetical protein